MQYVTVALHCGTLLNSRKIMLGVWRTWIVCLLISLPPVFRLVPYTYQPGLPVCTTDFSKGRATIFYSIFYTTITLVLPGVIILGCNIKVSLYNQYIKFILILYKRDLLLIDTELFMKLNFSKRYNV